MFTTWVGSYHATRIAPHSAPTWETLADGGCGQMSMTFAISPGNEHQALQKNVPVRVTVGNHPVYWGRLVDYNRQTGELVAQGEFFRNKLAIDGSGNATRDLGVAISAAIARGWNVRNPQGVGGVAHGEGNGSVQTIAELANEVAEQQSMRVGIDGRGEFYMLPERNVPSWMLAPGTVALGPTSEGSAEAVFGRYFDGTNHETITVGYLGNDEEPIDLTDRGTLTELQATQILLGAFDLSRGRLAWTGGVEVPSSHITTRGGTPAALASVVAGSMVRIPGLPVLSAGALWLDEIIGKTSYTAGEDSIYIEPVSTAPRTLRDVIAAA